MEEGEGEQWGSVMFQGKRVLGEGPRPRGRPPEQPLSQ